MLHLNGVVRFSVLVGNLVLAMVFAAYPGKTEEAPVVVASPPQTVVWMIGDYRPGMPEDVVVALEEPTDQVEEPSRKTVPKDKSKRCPQFEGMFKEYGLEPVETFSYIAWRESRCRIKAINATWDAQGNITWTLNENGTYDSGILQINSSWKTATRQVCGGGIDMLLMLDCNLKMGKYLLDNGGLGHWRMG